MSLASDAALLIYCDFAGDAREHDDWHSHEHLRERLSIPGFVRGTRWAREGESPRYMIIYEVSDAAIDDILKLESLRSLCLGNVAITREAVDRLKEHFRAHERQLSLGYSKRK